jgi:secondary thiamine-phosphate synthase enzyme
MNTLPIQTHKVRTNARNEMVEVTDHLRQLVVRRNILEGMLVVYVPHTTAAVTINENADPDVKSDMLAKLSELVPQRERYYQHAEGNSDSHVKSAMVGQSVTVLVEGGQLVLGRWQGVYFCEFDGPRSRELLVKPVVFRPKGAD